MFLLSFFLLWVNSSQHQSGFFEEFFCWKVLRSVPCSDSEQSEVRVTYKFWNTNTMVEGERNEWVRFYWKFICFYFPLIYRYSVKIWRPTSQNSDIRLWGSAISRIGFSWNVWILYFYIIRHICVII